MWTSLLELADLVPDGELDEAALAAGSDAVRETPRLTATMDEMLASAERREQLHRLIAGLLGQGRVRGTPAKTPPSARRETAIARHGRPSSDS